MASRTGRLMGIHTTATAMVTTMAMVTVPPTLALFTSAAEVVEAGTDITMVTVAITAVIMAATDMGTGARGLRRVLMAADTEVVAAGTAKAGANGKDPGMTSERILRSGLFRPDQMS